MTRWTDVARLRAEIVDQKGQIRDLRMDLYDVVYKTGDVPYRKSSYYGEITEPTPGLTRFIGQIAARLGSSTSAAQSQHALYHLDQGMGGGKSHALVGLYHMVDDPKGFFSTELGQAVAREATELADDEPDLKNAVSVVLCADRMTPGVASSDFGPALNLHERFLWALFAGRNDQEDLYRHHRDAGIDKAAITRALEAVDAPVLILIDELTDYGQLLAERPGISTEQAFLNSLFDATDNLPNVVAVVVMIRSDLDDAGYPKVVEDFREYITDRLERNGTTATVADAGDFAAIIRRRLFEFSDAHGSAIDEIASQRDNAGEGWTDNVFLSLPSAKSGRSFRDRAARTFPFHPDLMDLVEEDWSKHTGYQRVRSTVAIFAGAAYHWLTNADASKWVPPLIGVGDIPLQTQTIEAILSSGLLSGNDRAIANLRQVAASDVISKDGKAGTAVGLTSQLELSDTALESRPPVRMATALFLYSLVSRSAARRGATKAELLAAVFDGPELTYQDADIVFGAVTDDEEGLGSLEVFEGKGGNTPTRYLLSTEMTLRMHFRAARKRVTPEEYDAYMWERVKELASGGGSFDRLVPVDCPKADAAHDPFIDIDQPKSTRLVVLDPRCWTMLNGRDSETRSDIERLLGVSEDATHSMWAASVVVSCVNTQRRDQARKRAREAVAWIHTEQQLGGADEDLQLEAVGKRVEAVEALNRDLRRAYQHYSYVVRDKDKVSVHWGRFEDDAQTSLSGNQVWDALVKHGRAVKVGTLAGEYLKTLLGQRNRDASLAELIKWFWNDPTFPLVPSIDDVRRAIFDVVRTDDWAITDRDGTKYENYGSADKIPVTSNDLYLKKLIQPDPEDVDDDSDDSEDDTDETDTTRKKIEYARYRLTVPTRSLTNDEERDKTARFLMDLHSLIDPAETDRPDVQLIEVDVKLTAGKGQISNLRPLLEDLGGAWKEEDDLV